MIHDPILSINIIADAQAISYLVGIIFIVAVAVVLIKLIEKP
jgi:hypothetical protein